MYWFDHAKIVQIHQHDPLFLNRIHFLNSNDWYLSNAFWYAEYVPIMESCLIEQARDLYASECARWHPDPPMILFDFFKEVRQLLQTDYDAVNRTEEENQNFKSWVDKYAF